KAVMLLVGVGLDDRGFDFAADFGGVAEGDGVLDRGVLDYAGFRAKISRAAKETVRADLGIFVEQHGAFAGVGDEILPELGAVGREDAIGHLAETTAGQA